MATDKINLDDFSSGVSYDHWATREQLNQLLQYTQGTPRYHRFMELFADSMKKGGGITDAFKKASEEVASFKGATAMAAPSVRGLGTASTETGERMGILSSMTSATARGLSDMQRSAARVDGTMKGAYEDFTSVFEVVGRMGGGMISGLSALFGFNKGIAAAATGATGFKGVMAKAAMGAGDAIPKIVGVMAASVGVVMGVLDDFSKTFKKVGDLGVSFQESFVDLRVALGRGAMGFDQLEKQINQNSEAFALLGPTVHDGILKFAKIREDMNNLGRNNPKLLDFMSNLGFAAEDLNDFFLKDVRNRILSGLALDDAIDETKNKLTGLATETKKYSELTGESRKLLMQQQLELRSDPQWMAWKKALDPDKAREIEDGLNMMVGTLGFTDKQRKAVQDSLRMGGDISLLNTEVFGDAFAFLKFMPTEVRENLEGMIKGIHDGTIDKSQMQNMIQGYITQFAGFMDTAEGSYIAKYGKNIIGGTEVGTMMENWAKYQLIASKGAEAFRKLWDDASKGIADRNAAFGRSEQLAKILGNAYSVERIKQLKGVFDQGTLAKALQGDTDAIAELKRVWEVAGKTGGWMTQAIAELTLQATNVILQGISWIPGVNQPGLSTTTDVSAKRVGAGDDDIGIRMTNQSIDELFTGGVHGTGIFTQKPEYAGTSNYDPRENYAMGKRAIALEKLFKDNQNNIGGFTYDAFTTKFNNAFADMNSTIEDRTVAENVLAEEELMRYKEVVAATGTAAFEGLAEKYKQEVSSQDWQGQPQELAAVTTRSQRRLATANEGVYQERVNLTDEMIGILKQAGGGFSTEQRASIFASAATQAKLDKLIWSAETLALVINEPLKGLQAQFDAQNIIWQNATGDAKVAARKVLDALSQDLMVARNQLKVAKQGVANIQDEMGPDSLNTHDNKLYLLLKDIPEILQNQFIGIESLVTNSVDERIATGAFARLWNEAGKTGGWQATEVQQDATGNMTAAAWRAGRTGGWDSTAERERTDRDIVSMNGVDRRQLELLESIVVAIRNTTSAVTTTNTKFEDLINAKS